MTADRSLTRLYKLHEDIAVRAFFMLATLSSEYHREALHYYVITPMT